MVTSTQCVREGRAVTGPIVDVELSGQGPNALTHGGIASRLALPPGTVKGRTRLGTSKVRPELGPLNA